MNRGGTGDIRIGDLQHFAVKQCYFNIILLTTMKPEALPGTKQAWRNGFLLPKLSLTLGCHPLLSLQWPVFSKTHQPRTSSPLCGFSPHAASPLPEADQPLTITRLSLRGEVSDAYTQRPRQH